MRTLYLDAETVPSQRTDIMADIAQAKAYELAAALAAIRPPANYGEVAADKWFAEKGNPQAKSLRDAHDAEVEAAWRKTSLDGAYGQIFAIGFALDDAPPQVMTVTDLTLLEEASLLAGFFGWIDQNVRANEHFQTCVVGHNVSSFDLRFLVQRSIVHGIRPHTVLRRAAAAKPWEREIVYDTMVQWAGPGQRVSLDKLSRALRIPTPKGELTGATVWDFVQAKRFAEVAAYCQNDVIATREVHRRMTFQTDPF